jgi:pimeloyl-ACP methyl ester carboxylesterase
MGGAVAALVAAARPDRVSRLVLVDAAGFNLAREDRPTLVRLLTSPLAPLLEPLPGKRLLVERALHQVFYDDTFVTGERVSEYLDGAKRPGTLAAQRSLMASLEDRTDLVASRLSRIEAPTLVLWGRQDRWIPRAHAERFVSVIPKAREVILDACGHMPQVERAPDVSRLLLELLAETRADPGSPTPSSGE